MQLKSFKTVRKIPLEHKAIRIFYSTYLDALLIGDSQAKLLIYDLRQNSIICTIKSICQNYPFNMQECEVPNNLYTYRKRLGQRVTGMRKNIRLLVISSFNCHVYLIDQMIGIMQKGGKGVESELPDIRLLKNESKEGQLMPLGQQRALLCQKGKIVMGGSDLCVRVFESKSLDLMQMMRESSVEVEKILSSLTYNSPGEGVQFNLVETQTLPMAHTDIINRLDSLAHKTVSCGFDGKVTVYDMS